MEVEDDRVLTLLPLDAHGIGLVDEPPREPLEELNQALLRFAKEH